MLTVAYLANEFPSAVEPYVSDEIEELEKRGVHVVPGSVRISRSLPKCQPAIVLTPLTLAVAASALWLCLREWQRIRPLIARVFFRGSEGPFQRAKALVHTLLGACYAVMLKDRGIEHIHVHHGYFGSWIGMTAARLMDVGFSVTLHGSDLLLSGSYLDVKLANCSFCLTISEYNRRYILEHYPEVEARKILVARLGVDVPNADKALPRTMKKSMTLLLLAVGRLHAVKNHEFLVAACALLAARDIAFECVIAGDGPERGHLQSLIQKHDLADKVALLGHVPREQMDSLYDRADVLVMTSRSEGIPLVLMEAMARGKIVVAPAITGIPELVLGGKTGFLYESGSMNDLVDCLSFIDSMMRAESKGDQRRPHHAAAARQLDWIRHAARVQVRHNFNRKTNLDFFAEMFLQHLAYKSRQKSKNIPDENLILQQI